MKREAKQDNPSFIDLDVSSAAGGQEEGGFGFRWSGTWGYSWEIDDIFLQEAPMNDLRGVLRFHYGLCEYRHV